MVKPLDSQGILTIERFGRTLRSPRQERTMQHNRSVQVAGGLMVGAAVLANVGFTMLGSRFDYPDVLTEPAPEVLRSFHADATAIGALFTTLAVASALLIPIALLVRRLIAPGRTRQVVVASGIAAGVVQVIGLLRWPLLVPHFADVATDPTSSAAEQADAIHLFETFHDLLGGLVGETFGYALTAIWTVAMVYGLRHRFGRWFAPVGISSAALISTGLVEKLGVEAAGLTNFVGYIAWSLWIIAVGVALVRRPDRITAATTVPTPPAYAVAV
jgi:hypothetical protein